MENTPSSPVTAFTYEGERPRGAIPRNLAVGRLPCSRQRFDRASHSLLNHAEHRSTSTRVRGLSHEARKAKNGGFRPGICDIKTGFLRRRRIHASAEGNWLTVKLTSSLKKLKPKLDARCKKPLTRSAFRGCAFAHPSLSALTCPFPADQKHLRGSATTGFISNRIAALCGYRSHSVRVTFRIFDPFELTGVANRYRWILRVVSWRESASWSRSSGQDDSDSMA